MRGSAPALPIQTRDFHSPSETPRKGGGGTSSRHRHGAGEGTRKHQQRAWADYTPWSDYPMSPWPMGSPYAPGPFGSLGSGAFMAAPTISADGEGDGYTPAEPSRVWPPTPGPAALWPPTPTPMGAGMHYGFGPQLCMGNPPMMARGPPLQAPPPDVPAFSAMSEAFSVMASAAAAATDGRGALGRVGELQAGDDGELAEAPEGDSSPQGSPPADLPSKGSQYHGSGKCRPCAWFYKQMGCNAAQECGYCHLCPEGELKLRKKSKVAAMRMGALTPARQQGSAAGTTRTLKLTPLLS